jgi:hypothetical protein
MVLEKNLFVESVLRRAILRRLGEDEMAVYRAPFLNALMKSLGIRLSQATDHNQWPLGLLLVARPRWEFDVAT